MSVQTIFGSEPERARPYRELFRLLQRCSSRQILLKLGTFVLGFLTSEAILSTIEHTRGFEPHFSYWEKFGINMTVGLLFAGLGEYRAAEVEFRLPHAYDFDLRRHVAHLVRTHADVENDDKARIALSLMKAHKAKHEFLFVTSRTGYINLLTAATEACLTSFFATYAMPVSDWHDVSRHSDAYFTMLSKKHISKYRVVLPVTAEWPLVAAGQLIFDETIKYGIRLGRVPKERFPEIGDYALFDGRLVIEGTLLRQTTRDGSDYEMEVRILQGDAVNKYRTDRDRLKGYLAHHKEEIFMPSKQPRNQPPNDMPREGHPIRPTNKTDD